MWCQYCGEVEGVREDYGFGHAFGTEECWVWECERCGENLGTAPDSREWERACRERREEEEADSYGH